MGTLGHIVVTPSEKHVETTYPTCAQNVPKIGFKTTTTHRSGWYTLFLHATILMEETGEGIEKR